MSNIVLVRIDDRLIHGQVVTRWIKETKTTRVVIVDNGVAADEFLQQILFMAAPPGIHVDVYNNDKASVELKKPSKQGENILILVKTPQTLEALKDNGVNIKQIVVGGMGAAVGRKKFYKNISASSEELNCFKRLKDKGVEVVIQIMPEDKPVDVIKFI